MKEARSLRNLVISDYRQDARLDTSNLPGYQVELLLLQTERLCPVVNARNSCHI